MLDMCGSIVFNYGAYYVTEKRIKVHDMHESCIGGFVFELFHKIYATSGPIANIYEHLDLHKNLFKTSLEYNTHFEAMMRAYYERAYTIEGDGNDVRRMPASIMMTILWSVFASLYKNTTAEKVADTAKKRGVVACTIAGETNLDVELPHNFIIKLRASGSRIRSILHLILADFYKRETDSEFRLRAHYGIGVISFSLINEFMHSSSKVVAHVSSRVLQEYKIFDNIYKELKRWCAEVDCPVEAVNILYPNTDKTNLKECEYLKTVATTWKKESTKNEAGNTWGQFIMKPKAGIDMPGIVKLVTEPLALQKNCINNAEKRRLETFMPIAERARR